MNQERPKRIMTLLSVVERGKGKKLMEALNAKDIRMHFQCVGFGTAPTEMMDIFGLGSKDKDIIISFAAEPAVLEVMTNFGSHFSSYSEYGGLMMVLKPSAINRLVCEILNHGVPQDDGEGERAEMKNEHQMNLIMITVSQGYTDGVMQTAKRSGATGGTVIRGRLAEAEKLKEMAQIDIEEEREIIFILAPARVSNQIMEDVNREFGLKTGARGIMCAIPVEKAYKI